MMGIEEEDDGTQMEERRIIMYRIRNFKIGVVAEEMNFQGVEKTE